MAARWLALVGSCLLLGSCTSATPQASGSLQIMGLVIQNGSRSWVSSVSLRVPSTGGFVSCGNIPPGGACANTFPELYFSGAPIEVNWQQEGSDWTTGSVTLDVSEAIREAGRARVRVMIAAPGSAGASLLEYLP